VVEQEVANEALRELQPFGHHGAGEPVRVRGRSNSASAPPPVCTSWYQDLTSSSSREANASISLRCAASPRPLRPCSRVLTLKYPIAACIVSPPGDGVTIGLLKACGTSAYGP
jgi:hypothetical protein